MKKGLVVGGSRLSIEKGTCVPYSKDNEGGCKRFEYESQIADAFNHRCSSGIIALHGGRRGWRNGLRCPFCVCIYIYIDPPLFRFLHYRSFVLLLRPSLSLSFLIAPFKKFLMFRDISIQTMLQAVRRIKS